jgi:hypothetical protein
MIERVVEQLEAGAPWVRRAAPVLLVLAALGIGSAYGLGVGLLVFAGGVLLLAIGLFWSSLQGLTGESPLTLEEALHLAAPTAEEEQKRAVLRALKDLEYERSVGKISEEDYRDLSARYREEAKRLIVALDQGLSAKRSRAERLVAKRLAAEGLPSSDLPSTDRSATEKSEPEPEPASAPAVPREGATTLVSRASATDSDRHAGTPPSVRRVYAHDTGAQTLPSTKSDREPEIDSRARRGPTRRCAPCGTRNDLDARFCKGCGIALSGPGERLCPSCPAVYDESLAACPSCGVGNEESA